MVMHSPEAFEARLREVLATRYHDRHPFNLRMHEGALRPDEIRTWVRNRYYYQTRIPLKDGKILAKSEDPAFRREWIRRIHDHDGRAAGEGGLELWLGLAEAVGLDRDETASLRRVLPGVREACDDYVALVESSDLLTSVAASLTELTAGEIMRVRIAAFERHYAWIGERGLAYFRSRTMQAPRDAAEGLRFVKAHAVSADDQARCVAALERKCEILWRLLDAVDEAGRRPALSPAAQLRRDPQTGDPLVLLPERAIRLDANALAILEGCDGEHTADEIAGELHRRHPGEEGLETDVHEFLAAMRRHGVLELRA